ncbi:hypothetical protein SAY86_005276 [Trapa natans]|uniref:Uncharacterized protein n=1 Tax=Trapa natans TaxID=22666 RepID=A0AAN7L5B5_TRANT|nr:hypothetical protein SAY86_005276 [Trapa natans]
MREKLGAKRPAIQTHKWNERTYSTLKLLFPPSNLSNTFLLGTMERSKVAVTLVLYYVSLAFLRCEAEGQTEGQGDGQYPLNQLHCLLEYRTALTSINTIITNIIIIMTATITNITTITVITIATTNITIITTNTITITIIIIIALLPIPSK